MGNYRRLGGPFSHVDSRCSLDRHWTLSLRCISSLSVGVVVDGRVWGALTAAGGAQAEAARGGPDRRGGGAAGNEQQSERARKEEGEGKGVSGCVGGSIALRRFSLAPFELVLFG
jgi:hypothetical protein